MSRLQWQEGRSGGGYQKMTLLDCHWPIRWDMHLIKTPEGGCVLPHRDPLENMDHWRLNVVIKKPKRGGEFVSEESIVDRPGSNSFALTYTHISSPKSKKARVYASQLVGLCITRGLSGSGVLLTLH